MSYRVLARKYRPQTFEEIVGQAHVATTLTNALRSQKVAHAYLFSGPRGVGKTTTARILAKALNCAKGPTPQPCNACEACQRVAQGQDIVDIIEIDAASNRGIEEIRELRDNVIYAPAHNRYKVYIIDEAHQITHDAFNAFLKTLEEPPAHAVFILATTEHQKIPATILSRCQLFRFKRLTPEEITAQLEKILGQEKIQVEPAAIARLARAAGGAMRDALSLLDQALAFAPESLSVQQVETLLGFLPEELLQGMAGALLDKQPSKVLEWVRRLAEEGWDLPQFVRDFREFLREAMVQQLASAAKPESLQIAQRTVSLAELLQIIKVMGQAQDDMRWNDNPRLVLELYSLRLAQPFVDAGELIRRIEQLERGLPAEPDSSLRAERSNPPLMTPTSVSREMAAAPPAARNDSLPEPLPASPVSADVATQWKQLLAETWKRPTVGAQFEKARLQSSNEREWVVAFKDKYGVDVAQRAHAMILEALAKVVGRPIGIRFVQDLKLRREETETVVTVPSLDERLQDRVEEAPRERQPVVTKDEGVQKVLQAFKGRIRHEISE